jgi:hypothetical protein
VKIYDRVRERAALGKAGPFGDAPVTRVEFSKSRFKQFKLPMLATLADPFAEVWVGFGPSQSKLPSGSWNGTLATRRTASHDETVALLGLQSIAKDDLAAGFNVPIADLVAPGVNWAGWAQGLSLTGLLTLLDAG